MTPRFVTPPRFVATALCCAMSVSAVQGATAVEQKPPQEIADELAMNVGSVYTARSRVTARLREVMEELEAG